MRYLLPSVVLVLLAGAAIFAPWDSLADFIRDCAIFVAAGLAGLAIDAIGRKLLAKRRI